MIDARYDDIAEWYDRYVQERPIYREIILPGLFALTGDVRGQAVLDLACGTGFTSRELARRGARVTGVDLAERMLELACAHEEREPLGIRYVLDNAHTLASLQEASFDGASCSMGLMNIDDPAMTFQALRRVLKEGGWFVFSITHPCFETPHATWAEGDDGRVARQVWGYFEERVWQSTNPHGVRGKVAEHHRMLSTYVNGLAEAGFVLERMSEPQATGERAEQVPGSREVPSILLMRWRKG
jgi:ubiquinone/menaquinone biosynthesis C-methylase UbiE